MLGIKLAIPGLLRSRPGAAALDADAAILIAAMSSAPDATRQTLISNTIGDLKDAGIWDELDEIWFLAAHTEQAGLLGWKRYKDALAVNAPTFTTDRGFAGNGTTSYLNTQFVPSTDGVQYTLNDASLGVYSRTDANGALHGIGGSNNVGTNNIVVKPRDSGNFRVQLHTSAGSQSAGAMANSLGLFVTRRVTSTHFQAWRNGVQYGSDILGTSAALLTVSLFIGAHNNNGGTPVEFSTREHSLAFVGGGMTTQQQADLATIVEAYMDSVGAGVI